MTTLYLVRHGEAEGNLYRIAQGQSNALLTTRGWKQVALVDKRFATTHIDAVYASDLYRTCATASSVFESHNLPLQKDKRLREIYVGSWEGKTWGQIAKDDPAQAHAFSHALAQWDVGDGEDPRAVTARMEEAVRAIAAAHPDQTVAVFTHGYAIRLLLAKLQGIALEDLDKTPTGDNTAVSCLDVEGDEITVRFRDDVSHLNVLDTGVKRATAVQPGLYFTDATPEAVSQRFGLALEGGVCLLAHREDETVGFLQLLPEKEDKIGWIGQLGVVESLRNHGYGAQLLGQAVMFYRDLGRNILRMSGEGIDTAFFARYGFTQETDGTWVKEHVFDPRYL